MSKIANLVVARFMNRVGLSVGDRFENEQWRIHRYTDSIAITDLTFAGKRGKKVETMVVMGTGYGSNRLPFETLTEQYIMWAKRNAPLAKMRDVIKEDEEVYGDTIKVYTRTERGIDVLPGNFKAIFIRGAHVTIESTMTDFRILNINDDDNEPTCAARGKKSIGQFYKWVSENEKKVQSMTLQEIMVALGKEGIDYRYYCAMD